ncbi:GAF domain-containing protein [Spirulina subsalsa FACHB-351]|uniref:histidine kinase n=1 Tax=Spirulina subsalsa FACHB-351 TaxID=234711 RepID=A0ABT3L563_9CYAN|nr:GAF domain-containing protein [Spirulina subsalsa]MCW6036234.1 GAF domain-containing protein [Spirulina subsalsa FACHB-351]
MITTEELTQIQQQKALLGVITRIRQSLELETIFQTTVTEICQLLQSDRAAIFRFYPELDWQGEFICEEIRSGVSSVLEKRVCDHCFGDQFAAHYEKGRIQAVADIQAAGLSDCHSQILAQFQVRANLVVPLLKGEKLWGLICIHQCDRPRDWEAREIEFIRHIAEHLSVALQQNDVLERVQGQARELAQVMEREKAARYHRLMSAIADKIRASLEIEQIFRTSTEEVRQVLQAERVAIYRFFPDWSGEFVAESKGEEWCSLVGGEQPIIADTHLQETQGGRYVHGETFAIDDIYLAGHQDCHIALLEQFQARAYVIVPILHGEQLWGLLAAYQNSGPRRWESHEVDLLAQIGRQLAIALQQAELLAKTRSQAQYLGQVAQRQKTLASISEKIRRSLDLQTIFNTATQEVRQVLQAERVVIYRFLPDWSGEFMAESKGEEWRTVVGKNCPIISDKHLRETQGGRYAAHETSTVTDIYEVGFSPCHLQMLEQLQARAYMIVPIFLGENLWGLLAAYQNSAPRYWQADEVELLTQIGSQLGMAIQQGQYLQQMQAQSAQLAIAAEQEKSLQRQKTTALIIGKIRQSLDLATICRTAAEEVKTILAVDRVVIYRFNEDWSGEFVFESVGEGWIHLMAEQWVYPKLRGNLSDCSLKNLAHLPKADTYLQDTQGGRFTPGSPMRMCDDIAQAGFSPCYLNVLHQMQAKAYVIVGIYQGEKLWGLLAVYQNSTPRTWDVAEGELLLQVSEQLGVALQQAELLATTRQQAQELAIALQELKTAQTQLIHNEKMAGLGQLVAGIAHEINNPVNFIYGNLTHVEDYAQDILGLLELYRDYYPNPHPDLIQHTDEIDLHFLEEDLPRTLDSMKIGAERIRQLVLSLRTFSRIDEAEKKPAKIHEGIDSTLLILQHRFKSSATSKTIEVVKDYDTLPLVECYPAQLNQVFMNLLSNSIDALEMKYHQSDLEDVPRLSIQTRLLDHQVEIRLGDNGVGIPEKVRSRIFDPFFTTKDPGKGTGLGLSISYQIIVEKHKGRIECHSQEGQGTEFVIVIPLG